MICPACNGRCCRNKDWGHTVEHQTPDRVIEAIYEHDCPYCTDGEVTPPIKAPCPHCTLPKCTTYIEGGNRPAGHDYAHATHCHGHPVLVKCGQITSLSGLVHRDYHEEVVRAKDQMIMGLNERLSSENRYIIELEDKIDEWRLASGLLSGGDPGGVEPENLKEFLSELHPFIELGKMARIWAMSDMTYAEIGVRIRALNATVGASELDTKFPEV